MNDNEAKHRVVLQHAPNAMSSKFISNFQVHVRAATNYSVVLWGGAAFNAMQFSRQELINIGDSYMMKGFRQSIAQQHFQSCDLMCTYYYPSM